MDQPKYAERNAVVLGVSLDTVESHKAFCTKEGLNFRLLSDQDHKVSQAYGSLTNLTVVKFSKRNTFLIDPQGKIAKAYMSANPMNHSAEMLAALDATRENAASH